MAHFLDNDADEVVANVLVDTRPRHAEWQPNGERVWVSSEVGGTVSVIDGKSHEVVKVINFAIPGVSADLIQPVGMRFAKDGKNLFIALGPSNRVAVVDADSFEVKDYILVGQRPWHMEMGPDGKKLYVANGLTNDLTVIDVPTLKAEKSVPVGRLPGASPSSPELDLAVWMGRAACAPPTASLLLDASIDAWRCHLFSSFISLAAPSGSCLVPRQPARGDLRQRRSLSFRGRGEVPRSADLLRHGALSPCRRHRRALSTAEGLLAGRSGLCGRISAVVGFECRRHA